MSAAPDMRFLRVRQLEGGVRMLFGADVWGEQFFIELPDDATAAETARALRWLAGRIAEGIEPT